MDLLVYSVYLAFRDAFALAFRAAPGQQVWVTPTAVLALSGEPMADVNVAFIFGGAQPAKQLRAFYGTARDRGLPLVFMLAEELAADLTATAQSLGMEQAGRVPLMVYRPQAAGVSPAPYEITRVDDEQDLRAALTLGAIAFDHPVAVWTRVFGPLILEAPGVEIFLAHRDGVPMSTVWTIRGGRTLGIFNMATPPEHQRKGAGAALLAQVIAWHYERGATLFYLQATEAGYPLYERIGFQTVARPFIWVAGQPSQAGG